MESMGRKSFGFTVKTVKTTGNMISTATANPFRKAFLNKVVFAMKSTATSQKRMMASMLNKGAFTMTKGMRSSKPAVIPTKKITRAFLIGTPSKL
jgi:hypothetical protein